MFQLKMKDIKDLIGDLLKKELDLDISEIKSNIERPSEDNLGEFAFPCFFLAKKFKNDPKEIAKEISENLNKKLKDIDDLEKVEAVNGYLNFFVNMNKFTGDVFDKIERFKDKNKKGKGKVVIDFSSPNIGKPLHVGHIRSTIIGDSLMRIFEHSGWETYGINYINDEGLHIGKLLMAYKLWGNNKKLEKNPEKELLRLYVKYCKKEKLGVEDELEKSPDKEDNEEVKNEWATKALNALKKLEDGDKELKEIWKKIKKYSLVAFNNTYKKLDVEFDEIVGSSKFSKKGKESVKKLIEKGLAYETEKGAAIVKLERDDMPDKVVLRSDGTALYSTQDLGAGIERYNQHKFDKMVYVVGDEQRLYFKQLFKIFDKMGYEWAKKLSHVPFGLLNLEEGKISSREGNIVFLQDVINDSSKKALEEIKKKSPDLKNKEKVAEKVGVAALKYSTLSKEPIKNIEFSFKDAINFEGDTGPYLQYSLARANSILDKSKSKSLYDNKIEFSSEEEGLIKKLDQFDETVEKAKNNLNPSLIANYSYQLAKLFSEFYHSCKVIGSEKEEFRLELVKNFKEVIGKTLWLLGIDQLEEM